MRHHLLLAGLFATAILPATGAQPPDAGITVTAYRTPQELARAGSAVSVVDRDTIELRQPAVVADALRAVPGMAIARSGPVGAQTQVRMRGAEGNQLLVLVDGVEVNDLATDDSFGFEHLGTFDIERIEVVRGPQSALWGSDALAGVINVVTRTPTEPLEAQGYAEGGSFGSTAAGARLGLAGSRGTLVASFADTATDGTNAAEAGSEDDGYDNTTASLAGSLRVAPGLALDARVRHTDATVEYDGNDYVDGALAAVDADNETDVRQTYLRAGARLDLLDGRLNQGLHYAVTSTRNESAAEEAFPDADAGDGGYDRSTTAGDRYGLYYQATLRLTPDDEAAPGDLLTFAADHERQVFSQRAEDTGFGDPDQDQSLRTTGVALEYVTFLGRDLSLSAGVRHDDNSDFDDATTWRTTLSWSLPDSGTRLHGSYGTGQKAPTFYDRYGYVPDNFVGNPDLRPETSKGWDAGVEQRWGGRLVSDVTYFRADLEDEINGFWCPPPAFECTAINEPGASRRKGVEATVTAELPADYSLALGYTFTDATQPDGAGGDEREVRRPLHAASANLAGRWLGGRLRADVGAYYTGEREDDAFLAAPPYVARVALDAYTLVNIAASYAVTERVTVYGRVENALDEDYQDVYGFATPGVGGYLGVRVAWSR